MDGYSKLLHYVNLTEYSLSIDTISTNFQNLCKNVDTEDRFKNIKLVTEKKLSNLIHILHALQPEYRQKRDIFDGLGTVIKTISGNLDNHDLKKINRAFSSINENENNLNEKFNEQIVINSQMLERVNIITSHINSQQTDIESFLNTLKKSFQNEVNQYNSDFSIHNIFFQLIYDIELLTDHLRDIEESIMLAKLKIISKNILHPKELNYVYNILSKQDISIESEINLYELLELNAYYNATNIVFVIKIPIFLKEKYTIYHLKTIPFNFNQSILLPAPYLLTNGIQYQYQTHNCVKIERLNICTETKLQDVNKESCINNILNHKLSNCTIIEAEPENVIELLEPSYLYVNTLESTYLSSSCVGQQKKQFLQGAYVVRFDDCSIVINEQEFSDVSISFKDNIELLPIIHGSKVLAVEKIKNISITKLSDFDFEMSSRMVTLHEINNIKSNASVSISGSLAFLALGYLMYRMYKGAKKQPTPEAENQQPNSPDEHQYNSITTANTIMGYSLYCRWRSYRVSN